MSIYIVNHIHGVADTFSDKKRSKAHIYEQRDMAVPDIVDANALNPRYRAIFIHGSD